MYGDKANVGGIVYRGLIPMEKVVSHFGEHTAKTPTMVGPVSKACYFSAEDVADLRLSGGRVSCLRPAYRPVPSITRTDGQHRRVRFRLHEGPLSRVERGDME